MRSPVGIGRWAEQLHRWGRRELCSERGDAGQRRYDADRDALADALAVVRHRGPWQHVEPVRHEVGEVDVEPAREVEILFDRLRLAEIVDESIECRSVFRVEGLRFHAHDRRRHQDANDGVIVRHE
jgi:hypothetical protein